MKFQFGRSSSSYSASRFNPSVFAEQDIIITLVINGIILSFRAKRGIPSLVAWGFLTSLATLTPLGMTIFSFVGAHCNAPLLRVIVKMPILTKIGITIAEQIFLRSKKWISKISAQENDSGEKQRFQESFMFQLPDEECKILRFQFGTSKFLSTDKGFKKKRGGDRYNPFGM